MKKIIYYCIAFYYPNERQDNNFGNSIFQMLLVFICIQLSLIPHVHLQFEHQRISQLQKSIYLALISEFKEKKNNHPPIGFKAAIDHKKDVTLSHAKQFSLGGSRTIFSGMSLQRHCQVFQNASATSQSKFRGSREPFKTAYVLLVA